MINNYNSSGWRAGTTPETQLGKVTGAPPSLSHKFKSSWLMGLFLMAFMLLGINGFAQTAINYSLATTSGTFNSISATGTVVAINADDAAANITGLTPFTVNGTAYTNARMCSNGWVALYTTAPTTTTNYASLSTATTGAAVVFAPFSVNLNTSTVATTAAYTQTIGSVIIFEWKNFSRYAFGGGSDVLNFQVQLDTATGSVTFVYGAFTIGSLTSSPQVGWKTAGTAASNWATDINNLSMNITGSPTTCNWSNAVTGQANTSSMYLNTANSGVKPASGLTYTWTLQTGPSPVKVFAATSAITSSGATLSWTAPTGATSYNVQYKSPSSCSWTNWSGNPVATNTVALTGLTASTAYQVRVQANSGSALSIFSHIPNAAGTGDGNLAAGTFSTLANPCAGTPAPGNSLSNLSSVCAGKTVNLTLQNATTGSGITYQWQSSATLGGTYTNITGATTAAYTATVAAATFYQCLVTCSGNTGTSTPVGVTLNPFYNCYPAIYASSTVDEDISNVTIGTLNNSSNCTVAATGAGSILNRYGNYAGIAATPNVTQLDVVNFSLTQTSCGGAYGNGFQVYIDFNQNGSYAEANERVYNQGTATSGDHTETGTFTIPLTALTGITGMRVVVNETAFPTATNFATTSYSWGETEDYLINISAAPPCAGTPAPGNTVAANASPCYNGATTLSLSSTVSGTGVSYQWYKNATLIPAANNPTYFVTNIIAADSYYCAVTCLTSGLVGNSTTLVLSPGSPINAFPYTETFDASSTTASCWTVSAGAGASVQWGYATTDATNGPAGPAASTRFASLRVTSASSTYNTYNLFSPTVVLPAIAKQMRYSYFIGNSGSATPLNVFISVNGGAFSSIYGHTSANSTFATTNSVANWKFNSLDLTAYAGQTVQFAFVATSNNGFGTCNIGIDEITFENIPTCFFPTALAVASITNSGATASWVAPTAGTPVSYEYEVRTSGAAGSGATGLATTGSVSALTATLSGLTSATKYTVYVRTFCGGTDNSSWSLGVDFTTFCDPATVPYNQGFETITTAGTLPICVSSSPAVAVGGKVQSYIASAAGTNSALVARTGSKFSAVYWSPQAKGTVFSAPLALTAGVTYRATAYYNTDGTAWPTVGLYVGTAATEAAMTTTIQAINATATTGVYAQLRGTFTPTVSGTYYFGMQADNTPSISPNYCAFDDLEVVVSPPVVSSFSPPSICAGAGTTVLINGSGFTGATDVKLNGTAATSFSVNVAGTQVSATFPITATAGTLVVTNANGSGTSLTSVTVNQLPVVDPISGASNVMCTSTNMILTDTTVGGVWSTSNPTVASVTGGNVSALVAGAVVITYAVTIDGCTTAVTYPITVNEKVAITTPPASQTVVTGSSATFSIVATGTGLSYQWQVNANDGNGYVDISGATNLSYTIPNTTLAISGYLVRCVVSGTTPCGPLNSDFATLTVGDTGIATQPANQTICGSGSVNFSVVASGDVVSYQWYQADLLGDTALVDAPGSVSGATTANLTLSGLTTANNGQNYFVAVIGSANTAVSNYGLLTVNTAANVVVTSVNNSACYTGGSVVFNAAATGSFTGYQWEYSSDDFASAGTPVVDGTPTGVTYTNSTTADLTVTTTAGTPSAGSKYYRCVVVASAPCTNVVSASAQLLINEPTISAQPANTIVFAGNTATFAVTSPTSGATYQWLRSATAGGTYVNVVDGTPAGVTYTGNTSANLSVVTTGAALASTANFYKVKVTVPTSCDKLSAAGQLTINNYCAPTAATSALSYFDAFATTGGVTNITNNASGFSPAGYGSFTTQTVSQLQGQVVNFTTALVGTTVGCAIWVDWNQNAVFEASERVAVTPTYVSSFTGSFAVPANAVPGTTRMRILLDYLSSVPANPCVLGSRGEVEDYSFTVLVPPPCAGNPTAGTITSSVANVCFTGTATLTGTGFSTGVTGISFQWYNSAGLISGATSTTYTTPVLSASETYYMRVTCANGSGFSDTNSVTIGVDAPAVASTTPGSRCGTGTVALGASVSTGATATWYDASTGGNQVGSGATFTTPTIAATTNYYVGANIGGSNFNVGLASDLAANLSSLGAYGMYFSSTVASVISTVDVYPSTAGVLTVTLKNTTGTVVDSKAFAIVAGDISTTVKKTLSLNFNVPAASTGWSLNYDIAINRGGGTYNYPYTNNGFSITGNTLDGNNITGGSRFYFYNWSIIRGCNSARTLVTATVTAPPALAVSAPSAIICAGASTPSVTITAGTSDYDTYSWTPSTGLTGTPLGGTTFNPTATTTYTLNASQSAGLCANAVTYVVTVNALPAAINLTAPTTVCSTAAAVLLAVAPVNPTPSAGACAEIGNGQFPGSAFTATTCDGTTPNSVTTAGYAGEYSVVNTSANTSYSFTSSSPGDFVTIFNGSGTTVLAYGASPLSWYNTSEPFVRFLSVNTSCTSDTTNRTRSFTCKAADPVVFTPSTGLFTNAAGTTPYSGTSVTQVYAKPSATTVYTATATNAAGCTRTATTTVTVTPATIWYADADGDGYGNLAVTQLACAKPTGYVANSTDCNDANANVNPGKVEIAYNGIDDNCDGNLDEGFPLLVTTLVGTTCGSTMVNNYLSIAATQVAGATGYRFKVTNMATNSVQIIDRTPYFWFQFNTVTDLTYGTQYKIEVMVQKAGIYLGYYGAPCFVTTPYISGAASATTSSLSPASCGTTLSSINAAISANALPGVTGYRFRVTNTMTTDVQILDRTVQWFTMTMLPQWVYGMQYTVEVALKTTGTTYAPYGSICTVTTPAIPAIQNVCGTQITKSYLNFGTIATSGVTSYQFEVTNTLTNAVTTLIKTVHFLNFGELTGIVPATPYSIKVAFKTAGVYSGFSTACIVTSPGATREINAKDATPAGFVENFKVLALPNPFSYDFGIDMTSNTNDRVGIKIYDMIGKLIEAREVEFMDIKNVSIGENYPSGVYNVIVNQGENVKTLRVIKR